MNTLSDAEYVIIGGGAVGCGVAYALARAGKTDVLLLERETEVARVTTSQGAGLCGQVRASVERTRLAMHSVETFRDLQRRAEVTPDWQEVGSLRIALSERRAEEFRELKAVADRAGLETEMIDVVTAGRMWPLMNFSKARSILWCPSDGCMTPERVARSYRHHSQKLGVRFCTSTAVERIVLKESRVDQVLTDRGAVRCGYVVNAAGAHAYHVAQLVGLELPIVPVRHEYFVTVPLPGLTPRLPCFRVPELTLYGRVRDQGLLLGGWEPSALNTDPRTYEMSGKPPEIASDWTVLNSLEDSLAALFPESQHAKKNVVGKGWPTFTPDGRFIIGESTRVKGFVMAGGCNAHGISGSAGIGRLLVESLFDPKPSAYVRSLSPDRFTETNWNWGESRHQAQKVYETYYGV